MTYLYWKELLLDHAFSPPHTHLICWIAAVMVLSLIGLAVRAVRDLCLTGNWVAIWLDTYSDSCSKPVPYSAYIQQQHVCLR